MRGNPLQAIEAYVKYDSFGISGHLKLQCFNEDAAKNRLLYQQEGFALKLNYFHHKQVSNTD